MEEEYFDSDDLAYQLADLNVGEFKIDNGVSKAVIIFEGFDFVIKIPFNGGWYGWYNEETEEYEDDYFEEFTRADSPDPSDYCWDECINIHDAYDAGFGALFPSTSFLCKVGSRRFYIQEKVKTSRQFMASPSENSRERAREIGRGYKYCSEEWRAMVIELYGEEFFMHFVEWCVTNHNSILTDMHSANYGYSMDGAPIILDASGYREG